MSEKIIKKIAIFEYLSIGEMSCMAGVRFVTDFNRTDKDVMRVSEWMDVEFTVRKSIVQESLDLIDESTKKCYDEINLIKDKLIDLHQQKKELMLNGDVS